MRAPPKTVLRTLVGAFTLSMTAFGDTGGPLGMKAEAANNGSAFGYGVCAHVTHEEFDGHARTFEMMRTAGIGTVRCDFRWSVCQSERGGEFDFSRYDAVVDDAAAAGVAVLPILFVPPAWAKPVHKHLPEWGDWVEAAAAGTFFKGESGQDVTVDAIPRNWHDFPASLQPGSSATIRFAVPDNYAALPQTLRLKSASGTGTISAMLDGNIPLGEKTVTAGDVSRIEVAAGVLTAGNHSITLRATNGSPSLAAVSLSGSWQIGAADNSFSDFNAPNDATHFYLSDGNVHDFAYELKNKWSGSPRDFVFHFDVPAGNVDDYKYQFSTQLRTYDQRYPVLAYYSVNNGDAQELVNLPAGSTGKPVLSVKIPASDLVLGGENTIRIFNVADDDSEQSYPGYLTFDWYRFIATRVLATMIYVK